MTTPANPTALHAPPFVALRPPPKFQSPRPVACAMRAAMRDGSSNRRQLHRGRHLSIEAIQAVQALKRADGRGCRLSLERELDSKFRRLLKLDMIAVLRELLRQNECALVLKVFEDIRKEEWYKPHVSLYADAIEVFASNGLLEQAQYRPSSLQSQRMLSPTSQNVLVGSCTSHRNQLIAHNLEGRNQWLLESQLGSQEGTSVCDLRTGARSKLHRKMGTPARTKPYGSHHFQTSTHFYPWSMLQQQASTELLLQQESRLLLPLKCRGE
ncbi:protein THYLAKOID ASSEMBLY 8-like, chloroplastic isoform X2 [Punica granatum]|uniref:Protein THYLAKOID ASSEMBLY 8-like, chloroplastic isoform X2 n=1 Tax=Punica granatum TaxID=22663 RepID=A0A6P8DNC3_PUNGR|nr:protein THYLAKOID ASSEMBLY 8-like, chloroplastic isoform X2 [Punica granatum]